MDQRKDGPKEGREEKATLRPPGLNAVDALLLFVRWQTGR
jgi:hypothetical protein